MYASVMCVSLPTHVGAWSMAVLPGQPFEYYTVYTVCIMLSCI